MESVQLVFDYFCERTPRSFVEARESSVVWNYKYADLEFGKVQARDLLQHLWTGPISNAPVEIIQVGGWPWSMVVPAWQGWQGGSQHVYLSVLGHGMLAVL